MEMALQKEGPWMTFYYAKFTYVDEAKFHYGLSCHMFNITKNTYFKTLQCTSSLG